MEKNHKGVFDLVKGFKAVDPKDLAEFQRAMAEEVIPEIVQIVEDRRLAAAQVRHFQLTR